MDSMEKEGVSTPSADAGEEAALMAVFGGPAGELDPVRRAAASTRVFRRSHTGLAFDRGGAGLAMTASQALDAFGWFVMSRIEERYVVPIGQAGFDVATVQARRRAELGLSLSDLAERSGVPLAEVEAAEAGKRMPMAVLAPIAEALGLCPIRFGAVEARLPPLGAI